MKTRAYRRNSSRKGVLGLEMGMLRGHLGVEKLSQRKFCVAAKTQLGSLLEAGTRVLTSVRIAATLALL